MSEEQHESRQSQGILRVHEIQKTIRIALIVVGILVGLWLIGHYTIRVIESLKKPAWLEMCSVVVGSLGIPSIVIWSQRRTFRWYVRRTADRVSELERKIDAKRSGSGLEKDGTSEDGL